MDVGTILALNAGFLVVVLIVLVVVFSLPAPKRDTQKTDWQDIKHEIEHEAEQEAMEELMPYKPPRLNRPTVKRL